MPQNEITGLSINRCPWFHFAAPLVFYHFIDNLPADFFTHM